MRFKRTFESALVGKKVSHLAELNTHFEQITGEQGFCLTPDIDFQIVSDIINTRSAIDEPIKFRSSSNSRILNVSLEDTIFNDPATLIRITKGDNKKIRSIESNIYGKGFITFFIYDGEYVIDTWTVHKNALRYATRNTHKSKRWWELESDKFIHDMYERTGEPLISQPPTWHRKFIRRDDELYGRILAINTIFSEELPVIFKSEGDNFGWHLMNALKTNVRMNTKSYRSYRETLLSYFSYIRDGRVSPDLESFAKEVMEKQIGKVLDGIDSKTIVRSRRLDLYMETLSDLAANYDLQQLGEDFFADEYFRQLAARYSDIALSADPQYIVREIWRYEAFVGKEFFTERRKRMLVKFLEDHVEDRNIDATDKHD